jgi:AcrR family transcriptional regulator
VVAAAAPKTKWQVKREASHEALVDSAMRRFAEHGYAQTRVEDVVEGTGYTKGAFYFHFQNKLECFWAVLEHRERLRGDWVAEVVSGLEPGATLEDVLERTFAGFAESEGGVGAWVLVMVEFRQQHRHEADVRARLGRVYARWQANIARFLAALRDVGLVAAELDCDLLATETFAYVEGLTAHAQMYGLAPEAFQAALLDGIVALLRR